MKFLADENIPLEVVKSLQKDGIDVVSQSTIAPGADDVRILKEKRVIITLDKDFGQLVFKAHKQSNGVILLRVHPQSVEYLYSLLKKVLGLNVKFNNSFCVVERHRVRIVPLQAEK